jgi:Holin of 3TMs, for gene-transfer release
MQPSFMAGSRTGLDEILIERKDLRMSIIDAVIGPIGKLLDKIIPDPQERERAKLELLQLQGTQDMEALKAQLSAILAEAGSADPWTSRARPSFMYVMYAIILWSIPMGLIAAAAPNTAVMMSSGMTSYLASIPDSLWGLFGTGYLGYTVARQWGKTKGTDR